MKAQSVAVRDEVTKVMGGRAGLTQVTHRSLAATMVRSPCRHSTSFLRPAPPSVLTSACGRDSSLALSRRDLTPGFPARVCGVFIAQSCLTLCDSMNCSPQGSSVHGFLRQEYWSRLPCPPPEDLLYPGIKPVSRALQANSLPSEPPGKPSLAC